MTFAASFPIPLEAPVMGVVFAVENLLAGQIERSFYWLQNLMHARDELRSCS